MQSDNREGQIDGGKSVSPISTEITAPAAKSKQETPGESTNCAQTADNETAIEASSPPSPDSDILQDFRETTVTNSLLEKWETSYVFSIIAIALAIALNILIRPSYVQLSYDFSNFFSWPQWYYITFFFTLIRSLILPVIYAAVFYPSYFKDKPIFNSSKLISFLNLLFGGIIFGIFWNHNLTRKVRGISHRIFLIYCALLFIGVVGFASFDVIKSNIAYEKQVASEITAIDEWERYYSEDDGFSACFPSEPTIDQGEEEYDEFSAPYTDYYAEKDDGACFLSIVAFPEEQDIATRQRTILYDDILQTAEICDGAIDEWHNTSTFFDSPCASATFSSTEDGDTYITYYFSFFKENNLFRLIATGISEEKFTGFVDSFTFIDTTDYSVEPQKAPDNASSFETVRVFSDKVELTIPKEFSIMPEDIEQLRYLPTEEPRTIYTNESNTIDIACVLSESKTRDATVFYYLTDLIDLYKKQYPEAEFLDSGTEMVNGKTIGRFEFITNVREYDMYCLFWITEVGGKLGVFSFTCTTDAAAEWKPIAYDIMNSTRVVA